MEIFPFNVHTWKPLFRWEEDTLTVNADGRDSGIFEVSVDTIVLKDTPKEDNIFLIIDDTIKLRYLGET